MNIVTVVALACLAPSMMVSHEFALIQGESGTPFISKQNNKYKTTFTVVTEGLRATDKSKACSGKIFDSALFHPNSFGVGRFCVWDTRGKSGTLRGWVGVPDDENFGSWKISVDGSVISEGKSERGDRPIFVEIPIRNASSLRIDLNDDAHFFDPKWYATPKENALDQQVVKPSSPSKTAKKLTLLSPKEGAVVSGDLINLRWEPVEGATTYAVSIVSYEAVDAQSESSPRIWSATSRSATFAFDLKSVPNGKYLWSVIAFGPKKPLGGFSEERMIVVDR